MSTSKVLLGTLVGLAIGALTGILFAPEKGSTTRKQILDKGDDYLDELKSKLNGLSHTVSEKYESTKRDVENFAEKGKAKYDNVNVNA